MSVEILRILWSVWALGAIVLTLNAFSVLLFGRSKWKKKAKIILALPFYIICWPLAIFSPNGRKVLFCKINQL